MKIIFLIALLLVLTGCPWVKPDPQVSRTVKVDRFYLTPCRPLSVLPNRPVTPEEVLGAVAQDQLIHAECMKKQEGGITVIRKSLEIIEQ